MVGFTFLEMEAKVPVKKSIMKPLSLLPPCLVSTHLSDEPLILFIISQQITFLFFVLYMWFKTPVTNIHYLYFFGQHREALEIFTEEFLCLLFLKTENFLQSQICKDLVLVAVSIWKVLSPQTQVAPSHTSLKPSLQSPQWVPLPYHQPILKCQPTTHPPSVCPVPLTLFYHFFFHRCITS